MEEQDPEKCNALESSLWELKTLQNHYHHFIAKKACKFSHAMQPEETPLDDLLEIQTSQVVAYYSPLYIVFIVGQEQMICPCFSS